MEILAPSLRRLFATGGLESVPQPLSESRRGMTFVRKLVSTSQLEGVPHAVSETRWSDALVVKLPHSAGLQRAPQLVEIRQNRRLSSVF
jgi:hypothetical protein